MNALFWVFNSLLGLAPPVKSQCKKMLYNLVRGKKCILFVLLGQFENQKCLHLLSILLAHRASNNDGFPVVANVCSLSPEFLRYALFDF